MQISFAVTAKLISAFVFATWIVQSLYFLNPKFQASSHLLWLYSPVCVGPGRKPRRQVFSQRGSYRHTACFSRHGSNELQHETLLISSEHLSDQRIFVLAFLNELRHEKTNVLVSDLVRHKPGCTATEDS